MKEAFASDIFLALYSLASIELDFQCCRGGQGKGGKNGDAEVDLQTACSVTKWLFLFEAVGRVASSSPSGWET